MAKKYDDFDEGEQDGVFGQILNSVSNHKRAFAVFCVAAAVILLGLVVYGSYPDSEEMAATESVPIVRADAGDYKTAPDNPGGMDVPYRDSTVFSGKTDGGTENILADETNEEPVPRSQLFAGLNTDNAAGTADQPVQANGEVEATQQALAQQNPAAQPPSDDALVKEAIGVPPSESTATASATTTAAPASTETAPTQTAAATLPEAAKSAKTDSEETSAAKPIEQAEAPKMEPAKVEPAAGAAKDVKPGGFYVQLASVKNAGIAGTEWKKLQAKHSALGGLKYRAQEVNLGAKGTFHRIQAGPMSKDDATRICNDVKKSTPGGCLIVAK